MGEHIVKTYDEELKRVSSTLLRMGGVVEGQIAAAIQAVARRDSALAQQVIEADRQVDELDADVDHLCTRLLALRQPMAVDLRAIISAIKITADLERIGDYAKNIAKRAIALSQGPSIGPLYGVPRIGGMVQRMVKDVLDAYAEQDVDRAIDVWKRDEEVDELYNSLFRELLTYMMEDPRNITACTHLLFIAMHIERWGDHATNIAEIVYFLISGRHLSEARPKGDVTSSFAGPVETPEPGKAES